MNNDTIAAIGTAMTHSGIGIVRISGSEAIGIADRIFRAKKSGKKLADVPTHTLHYGHIVNRDQIIDEVLVSVMRGPHSYTAEDVVEINCHGGILVMKKILDTVMEYGARPAEAGEFTKRAFLNGRMDLSQAEAVIDIINSQNEFALKSAVKQLSGSVSDKIKEIRKRLIYEIAYIESALDDPEHYPMENYGEELAEKIEPLLQEIRKLTDHADDGRMLKEGIKTVILGKPNAGKSSLLNLMVGSERAIVTDIEGTTRDTLEEHILLDGISLNIVDTAGIRETADLVEQIGVERAKEQAAEADLVLYVIDATKPLDENDKEIIQCIADKKAIVLFNKCDLDTLLDEQEIRQMLPEQTVVVFSAKDRTGFEILKDRIREMFYAEELKFNDEIYLTSARHKAALDSAYRSLQLVMDSIAAGMPEDFFTIDMMSAYEQLGYITGESVEDDLVNEIFSKFCMGK
ncbi:MAG: tRNA uridine-5-carboxymethylaminomethyl(34) synthesis GTPase MnmE [Lachnospiraceae bacterium]|nr:tRNA uridine-5-carboxymethylaminomethyl(34) synthesis GTPase MnmE [Lachnospiraceae bacterium]